MKWKFHWPMCILYYHQLCNPGSWGGGSVCMVKSYMKLGKLKSCQSTLCRIFILSGICKKPSLILTYRKDKNVLCLVSPVKELQDPGLYTQTYIKS